MELQKNISGKRIEVIWTSRLSCPLASTEWTNKPSFLPSSLPIFFPSFTSSFLLFLSPSQLNGWSVVALYVSGFLLRKRLCVWEIKSTWQEWTMALSCFNSSRKLYFSVPSMMKLVSLHFGLGWLLRQEVWFMCFLFFKRETFFFFFSLCVRCCCYASKMFKRHMTFILSQNDLKWGRIHH